MTTLHRTPNTHWLEYEEEIDHGNTTVLAIIDVEFPIYEATIDGHTYSTRNLHPDVLYDLYRLEDHRLYNWALQDRDKLDNALAEWYEEPYDEDGCATNAGFSDTIPLNDLEYDDWEPFDPTYLENEGILELLKETTPID